MAIKRLAVLSEMEIPDAYFDELRTKGLDCNCRYGIIGSLKLTKRPQQISGYATEMLKKCSSAVSRNRIHGLKALKIERKDDERLITRVLQRETNRAQLAVCPPPESKTTCSFCRLEVDRMPINSVRNPLLNPHES
ncbi:hypothetical protein NC652_007744 [Populus alba x Populus x berolinensis]|nr:hypothetical protein NC652_007744 [Populus alba x Populus x berolinensis]